jgi:hypothetical protein
LPRCRVQRFTRVNIHILRVVVVVVVVGDDTSSGSRLAFDFANGAFTREIVVDVHVVIAGVKDVVFFFLVFLFLLSAVVLSIVLATFFDILVILRI